VPVLPGMNLPVQVCHLCLTPPLVALWRLTVARRLQGLLLDAVEAGALQHVQRCLDAGVDVNSGGQVGVPTAPRQRTPPKKLYACCSPAPEAAASRQ
jgi:hypothetical protein